MRKEVSDKSLESLASAMGLSRQSHYKWLHSRRLGDQQSAIIVHEVKKIRHFHPRMGCRKLHFLISQKAEELGFRIGRDRFFKLLDLHNLLVSPKKQQVTTTLCRERLRDYQNYITGKKFRLPNQAWALDITYLRLEREFRYLALVKDLFSHKIIGSDISDTLATDGAIRALKMALKQANQTKGVIHHSDNGIQYDCAQYRAILHQNEMQISRAAKGCPWENGSMERTIGCLKGEYGLDLIFKCENTLEKTSKEGIYLYNHQRPHLSNNFMTPAQKHRTWNVAQYSPN